MGLIKRIFEQAAKPTGKLGRFVGKIMNRVHYKLHCWGLEYVSIATDATVLDVGCGGGVTIKEMAKKATNGKLYGIDYSNDMVELTRKTNKQLVEKGQVELVQGTVSSLPYPNDMFDLVTAFETTYFWPNLIDDLKEVKRVLKPGGTLLIVNEVYIHEKFERRNVRMNNLVEMQLHTPKGYNEFLVEAGYAGIDINDRPERNWIAAVAKKA